MGHWLEPSLIATLIVTIVMFSSFSYLYRHEHKSSLKYFSIAWILYSLRFLFRLISLHYSIPLITEIVNYLSNFLNSGFLVIGVNRLFRKGRGNQPVILLLSSAAVIALLFVLRLDRLFRTSVVFFIAGTCYIYIGYRLLKLSYRQKMYLVLGINFILWGLHKYDYPLLYNSTAFAPLGYMLAVLFSIIAAQGFHLLYYQTAKDQLQYDKECLADLLDVIKINDIEQLLDEALKIAVRITESEYGYIYHYSEDDEVFILNTWSPGVYSDCEVANRHTTYKLADTGCWGEAVRQRKPFLLNDYKSDSSFRKGTPEGHVNIKKFLTVPFFSGGRIRAVIGVANKRDNYDDNDIRQLSLLMNNVWKIVEVKEYQAELKNAKKQAEESSSIKSAFLANISHELRTPLNGTLGMLSLVMDKNKPENADEYIRMAYKSSEDMLYLVEDILSFSQYNGRQLKPDFSDFDLIDDMRILVELNRLDAEKKGLKLELLTSEKSLKIRSDKIKFNQIIINLINNAIKFSEKGRITLSIVKLADNVRISIRDQGIGIPNDKLDLIFEPFYQLEDPYTKTHKGIGAGLAIVKSLCELLDIRITVESENRGGTNIILDIDRGLT